jgi:hypothetical protein
VLGAGYTTSVPLAWKGAATGFDIENSPARADVKNIANLRQVSTDYLQLIGVPAVEGRHFEPTDNLTARPVAIINETMAHRYWPGERAIGKRIKPTDDQPETAPWLEIVGVAGDVRQMGLDVPVSPEMYVPYGQFVLQPWFAPRDLVVRTAEDPAVAWVSSCRRSGRWMPRCRSRTWPRSLTSWTTTRRRLESRRSC